MKTVYLILIVYIVLLVSCKKDTIETPITPIVKCLVISTISKTEGETYILVYEYDTKGRRVKRSLNSLTTNYYVDEYIYESSKIIHNRKFKDKVDYQWIYLLNSDGTLASSSTNKNGKIETEISKYNKEGYLIECIYSSGGSTTNEYIDGNLSNKIFRASDGNISKTTYQYYTDKLDTHDTDYFITPGLLGKGNKNLVKSYTITSNGNVYTVNESYLFDDKGNTSQITHDSKDVNYQGVDKFTYECR